MRPWNGACAAGVLLLKKLSRRDRIWLSRGVWPNKRASEHVGRCRGSLREPTNDPLQQEAHRENRRVAPRVRRTRSWYGAAVGTILQDRQVYIDRSAATLASVAVAAMGAVARRGVPQWDAAAFSTINGLPNSLYGPVWPVMQLGSLASVGVVAGLTRLLNGPPQRAGSIALAGGAAWLICKPLKRMVGRSRPDPDEIEVRVRGRPQTGLGYPSGHAAVAAAMGAVVAKGASRRQLGGIACLAGTVGISRIYIGAHYPLDIAGGWVAGLAMATVVRSFRR